MCKKIHLLLWSIGLLSTTFVYAEKISVEARLDSISMMIGNQNKLYLEVSVPDTSCVQFPAFDGDSIISGIEILDRSKRDSSRMENDCKRLTMEYLITSFDEGLYYIPFISVSVDGRPFNSNDLSLKVMTYEVDTANVQIFDIKPLQKAPFVIGDYLGPVGLGFLGIFVIMLVIYYITRIFSKEKIEKVDPEMLLPPHVVALQALDEIKAEKIWTQGQFKTFHTQLTDVLRKYVSRRFQISAMEMTTAEIISALKKDKESKEVIQQLKQILELSDFVKFAKMNPLPEENESALANAYLFVDETKQEKPETSENSTAETESSAASKPIFNTESAAETNVNQKEPLQK